MSNETRKRKRKLLDVVHDFYDYLKQYDMVNFSQIRKDVVNSPSDKNILNLILDIQEREYVYVKRMGRELKLKLSTHKRDPKVRYVQIGDIIENIEKSHNTLQMKLKTAKTEEYGIYLDEYRKLVNDILQSVINLRENKQKPVEKENTEF
jgi:hypothetical protein